MAGQIKQTPNSIGYIELIYAIQNKMAHGNVRNAAGKFVQPNTASVTAAAAGALKDMPEDFRVSITNAAGKDSYPISSFTWLLIPAKIPVSYTHLDVYKRQVRSRALQTHDSERH